MRVFGYVPYNEVVSVKCRKMRLLRCEHIIRKWIDLICDFNHRHVAVVEPYNVKMLPCELKYVPKLSHIKIFAGERVFVVAEAHPAQTMIAGNEHSTFCRIIFKHERGKITVL